MSNWENSPRYKRAMQKIAALRPEHKAILQTVTADASFADEAMRKRIDSMVTATGNMNRERNFGLTKRMAEAKNAMSGRDLSYNKGQGKKAFAIGLGNLGLSAAGGVADRKRTEKLLEAIRKMGANLDPVVGVGSNLRFKPRVERGW